MYVTLGTPRSIEDLSGKSIENTPNLISSLRSRIKVMVIDDVGFAQKGNLRSHGYDVHVEKDLASLAFAEGFQIILCDLQGVGKQLGGESGGFLIKELKKNYPQKFLIAYSGHTFDATFNKYLNLADGVMKKDAGVEEWLDMLDNFVKSMIDPIAQWKRARTFLINQGIRMELIMHLEDEYVGKVENSAALKKWQETRTVQKLKPAAQKVIIDLVAGILVGAITGK